MNCKNSKLSLLEENHDEILDSFDCKKEDILRALDNFFSSWLANPFEMDHSKDDKQNHFELYLALKKQVDLMEYMPDATKRLAEIKANDLTDKYSKLQINVKTNIPGIRKN